MNKRLLITIAMVVILLGVASVVAKYLADQKTPTPQSEKRPDTYFVNASAVKYQRQQVTVNASGRVTSTNMADMISEVQGRILGGDVLLKKGQSFHRDDVLVRIYKQDMEYNLKAMKSSFLNLLATSLPDLKIDYPGAYPRWESFFNNLDIDKPFPVLPDMENSQLKIFLSSRNLLNNYYNIKSQEEQLKKYTITAPFDGTYTEVMLEKGSVANPGSPIARMIRTDLLEVEVPVPATEAKYLSSGDSVVMKSDNTAITYLGVITRKAAFIDQNTQSQSIFVSVANNREYPLYQGQYLDADFKGRYLDSVMELPRNAVFNGNKVYTVADGKLVESLIEIHKFNETTLLFKGVEEDVMIVTEPLINAKEGTAVEIL
ncbi:MAG TPA: efflux RND transporter periplasmic adaptor subunit [Bacteroidales bacterium]|nr:efflux RND transporter periplasmic adaptor subunit [Bacteroidales bacterium]